MNKSLKDVSAELNNANVTALKNTANAIFEEIVTERRSTIPEVVFVEYFLDFFKRGMIDDANSILGVKWIELARSPFNYVDVIDMQANILYTVPPLIMKPVLANTPITDVNFSRMASTYQLKNNRLPTDATNYLNHQLNGLEQHVNSNDLQLALKQWEYIFSRYAKPVPKQTGLSNINTNNNMDGMINYD